MKKLHLIAFCLFGCSDLISVFYEIDVSQEQRMDFLLPMKIDQQIQMDQQQDHMIIPCGAHCPEIEMIFIEAGSFNIGSGNGTEQPIQEVQIRRNFYVSKTEMTVGQYRTCVDARHCSTPICDVGISNWTDSITSNEVQPMNCINWHEARIFAKWVGGDLLTEAQWEYVAKSKGKSITYPWGDMNPNCQLAKSHNKCMYNNRLKRSTIN
jgi:formylglycine-generating enzyme required for sulfatase activity